MNRTARRRRQSGKRRVLGAVGWLLLLLGALGVVIWRQTMGVTFEQGLRELQSERALVEAERMELERRIQTLTGRSRVVAIARERLEMHLPADREIVFLPMPAAEAVDAPVVIAGAR